MWAISMKLTESWSVARELGHRLGDLERFTQQGTACPGTNHLADRAPEIQVNQLATFRNELSSTCHALRVVAEQLYRQRMLFLT